MRTTLSFALFLGLIAVQAPAQVPTGGIDGQVRDESGAVIPGANVSIRNKETGASRAMITSDDGTFSAPLLPAGPYEVRVEAKGFRSAILAATVQTGSTT